jgi:glycosyltransferase involved in cell wall biosynthesis
MLAILTTHPIQYQVPLWKALAKEGNVPFEVWYMSDHATRQSFDSEFKQSFAWDLDMLEGYPSRFLKTNANHDVARFSRLRLAESLKQRLRESKVKALWIQGWQVAAYWQAVWQAHSVGVPVWLRGESNDLGPAVAWKKPIKKVALGQLFSKVSKFLYIGEANRRFYKNFGVRDEQLSPAYYCVDNDRFRTQADELRPRRAEIRKAWNIPENTFCVLFAGKFIPKKHPGDVIKAIAHLKKNSLQNTHLLFVGSGGLGDELRNACRVVYDGEPPSSTERSPVNGEPTASFTGFLNQTEISKAYVAADCLVLPSDFGETWGLVVNEAMASDLPCVVSDACGCAEDLIAPITPDLQFPLGNINSIENALRQVSMNPPDLKLLRSQVDKFRLSASIATIELLYKSADRPR